MDFLIVTNEGGDWIQIWDVLEEGEKYEGHSCTAEQFMEWAGINTANVEVPDNEYGEGQFPQTFQEAYELLD